MIRSNLYSRSGACAGVVVAALLMIGVAGSASAVEIIPSIGISKLADGSSDETNVHGGLALRGNIFPVLKAEVGVAYRSESLFADNLNVRMWPVTASLWLAPVPALYVGGGVGWYNTTFDFDDDLPLVEDRTEQLLGMHVGGGINVPLSANLGLDFNGRYVFMESEEDPLPPEAEFDPDFWSTSVGLAFRF